jgi:cell division inhibitor SepF
MEWGNSVKRFFGLEDSILLTEEDVEREKQRMNDQRTENRGNVKQASEPPKASVAKPMIGKQTIPARKPMDYGETGNRSVHLALMGSGGFDEECPKIVDRLKGKIPVIVNLDHMKAEDARKVFDFLSGATYAINGTVIKISESTFIFVPDSVKTEGSLTDISGTY